MLKRRNKRRAKLLVTLVSMVSLFALFVPGLFLMAPVAVAAGGSPYAGGVWLTGDHHMHTTASDGSHDVVYDVGYAEKYGLDFIAITNHGGKANEPKIYAEYEEIVNQRVHHPNLLIFHGFEWNVPGGEHATFMVAPGSGEREQVRDFMTKFDASFNPQADAIEALKYAEKMNPKPLVLLNHPSRKGKYSLEEIRAYDDAGTVAAGMEGAPGHQAGADRGEYAGKDPGSSRTFGGFDKMVAEVGGLWDTLLSEGRKWFITANSDFHQHVTEGGADFWPGQYSKTYVWAREKSYAAVLDSLRNGRSFVVHGDLIDALEFSAQAGGQTAVLGETLTSPRGADVKVTIKVRDPQTANNHGENPELKQVQLISNASGTPGIAKVFKAGDWVEQDGWLVMEHTFKNVTRDFYVRVRGSNTDEINPAEDPQNEDAWQDLWFYSNPIFVKVAGSAAADIQGHWAQKDIELMAAKGVVHGVAPNKFAPDAPVTRAEFAAMLVNALGVAESTKVPFKDVPENSWYYQSVARAYAAGLVKGVSSTEFAPQAQITRQEMAAMMVRALAKLGRPVGVGSGEAAQILARFRDRQKIAPWAADALAAAVEAGVVAGRGNSLVAPTAKASRAEAVVMIKRVLQTAGKM